MRYPDTGQCCQLFPLRRGKPYLAAVKRILTLTPKENGCLETISSSVSGRSKTVNNAEILRSGGVFSDIRIS